MSSLTENQISIKKITPTQGTKTANPHKNPFLPLISASFVNKVGYDQEYQPGYKRADPHEGEPVHHMIVWHFVSLAAPPKNLFSSTINVYKEIGYCKAAKA
ncbi:MAG: hypothetical protein LUQ47_05205 [Methanotrichaceae archaeon]|nr:hypothetical protein [Methanotrichaceae archaeon]